jgi:hypothetical protein
MKEYLKARPHFIPALVIALLLVIAVFSLPYGYYQFLRWATCATAVYIAVMAYFWNQKWATWVFGAIAILFNPIFPIYLTKEIWRIIDIICGVVFISSIPVIIKPKQI